VIFTEEEFAMRRMPWAVYIWPGLPEIWRRGHWTGLAKAVGAALVLNVVLIVSFGWSELIGTGARKLLWFAFASFWTASATAGYMQAKRREKRNAPDKAKDGFPRAMDLYLQGDHFQAECLLVEMLGRNERDLDARLMLATLYRHNRRYNEAAKQLDTLGRFEGAEKWELEIGRERMLIEEGKKETGEQDAVRPAIEPAPRTGQAA
jgi:hypothetical protein